MLIHLTIPLSIWEISGGYSGGSLCGPWNPDTTPGTQYHFIVNVTVPDCSGAPWIFPWNIFGDRFSATEPYDVAGTISIDRCVEPSIVTTNPYNFTSFDHPDSVTGGTTGTQAFGMNDSGLIVGIYETAGAVIHGYLYDGTNFTPIDYPGAVSTYAVSINNSNKVVGYYKDGADVARGFIYKDGIFTSFEKPGATSTTPLDINDSDYMSGSYIDATGIHGFIITDPTFHPFDYPGTQISLQPTMVSGIANSPRFSGRYVDSTGKWHGFAITGSIVIDLFYPEGTQTLAYRIGNDGVVTGFYSGSDLKRHGFVTGKISIPDHHNIVYTPVDYPGAEETTVYDSNGRGNLVGNYKDSHGNTHGYLAKKFPWILYNPAIGK